MACHHCGHRERVPDRCDACGSLAVARYGAGTERIEAELTEALDVPVFRLDADTAGTKDAVPRLLARFDASPRGLLLGTQMVAKGHDFPDVTLGVVLDADSTLRFPDFRAEERTFALIAQLAGPRRARSARRARAGPDDRAGRAGDRGGVAARHAGLRGRRARPPRGAALPAVRRPDPGRLPGRGRSGRAGGGRAGGGGRGGRRAPTCWGRRRCSACAAASASRWWSRRPSGRPPSPRSLRRSRGRRETAFSAMWPSPWTSTRNRLSAYGPRGSDPSGRG